MTTKKLTLSFMIGLGLMLALVGLLGGGMWAAGAATITVDVFTDGGSPSDGDCTLREAIHNANADSGTIGDCTSGSGNDTITLGTGTYTLSAAGASEENNTSGDLDITGSGDLTIVGAGAEQTVIDAAGIDRVLHIHSGAGSVTISGVTIANGSVSADGGGIAHDGMDLTLTDVIVRDNTAAGGLGDGGGVYVYQGSLTLDGSQVLSNTATYGGGGVYVSLSTAAFTQTGDTVVAYNTAFLGGGVDIVLGRGKLVGGQIVSNTATGHGGGVYVNLPGAAFTQTGESTIGYNTAADRGGGVYIGQGSASLSGGRIISNTANGTGSGDGGGGVYVGSGSVMLNGARTLRNVAWRGGGVFIAAGSATLNGGQILHNNATGTTSEDGGGGVYVDLVSAVFTQTSGSTIGYNNATNRNGGGIHIDRGSVSLSGGYVVSNTANNYGGGVYVYHDVGMLTVSGGHILSNTANFGGGVHVDEGNAALSETRFSNNTASSEGGGLYVDEGSATLVGGQFIDNAASLGGGILVGDGDVALSGGQILSNTAEAAGGVFVASSTAVFTQTGETLIAYNAGTSTYPTDCGGGVLVGQGRATLSRAQIVRNTAIGGAGLCNGGGTLTLINGTLSHNTSSASGGGLWNYSGMTVLTYTTVASNTAASGGSGIHMEGGTVQLKDSILAYGGAANCNTGLTSNGYNLEDDNTCGLTGTGDVTDTDPLLGPLMESGGSLVHPLLTGSPAVDAGDCIVGITTDQRGTGRPQGDECDIGAFEQVPPVLLPLVLRSY